MSKIKLLGVLLCYNDVDILEEAILHLLNNNHELIVWDHGSDDGTAALLDKYQNHLAERRFIPRAYDFYNLYQAMSDHLITDCIRQYDWISWPDQDELLEGPDRSKRYDAWIEDVFIQGYDSIQFNNFNYWITTVDDLSINSPVDRIKHYSIFPDCAPRIRAWRASKTNTRIFNHNPVDGEKLPWNFNLRHYPMRTVVQMNRRLDKDRANLERGGSNYHYDNLARYRDTLIMAPELLHYDNGTADLDPTVKYNWRDVYGYGPAAGK